MEKSSFLVLCTSSLADRKTYCIDSGYVTRVEFDLPAGTCALICTEYGLHYVSSLSASILVVPLFLSPDIEEADRPIIVPYEDLRIIAIRRQINTTENVRAFVITPLWCLKKNLIFTQRQRDPY